MAAITLTLAYIAKLTCGIVAARAVGKGINAIGEKVIPYEKTRTYKQTEQSAQHQRELERLREAFNERQQKENFAEQERLAIFNRQTQVLLAEYNKHFSLRNTLVQDAIRNFPLNISPLVLLENNNIDISFLWNDNKDKDSDKRCINNIIDGIGKSRPLNVFITPMHIDSRVNGKEVIAAQVFDSIYSNLETLFVNEYSRNSERPVMFYSAAWNKNVKGGLHSADELYFFLKDLPTIVVEPRFDGKNIKIMFSCWSVGYSNGIHSRQELQIPLDLNSMLAVSVYERSKKALESFSKSADSIKPLSDSKATYLHNISVFKELNLESRIEKRLDEISKLGYSSELDELGDYSKFLYIKPSDISDISETLSAVIGMLISAISDTHHLLVNDIKPQLPYIYKKYFGEYCNEELRKNFSDIYERTYLKLSQEFPEQGYRRSIEKESIKKILCGDSNANKSVITEALLKKCQKLGIIKNPNGNYTFEELTDYYIDNIDNDKKFIESLKPFMTEKQKNELSVKLMNTIS